VFTGLLVAILLVSLLNRRIARSSSAQNSRTYSRTLRQWGVLLVIVYELLWAAGGFTANLVSATLPKAANPYIPLIYGGAVVFAVLFAAVDYKARSEPSVEETNRKNFLDRLHTRYIRRQEDALRGAMQLILDLHAVPDAVSRPGLIRGMLTDGVWRGNSQQLPQGTDIASVYDAAGGKLLILGKPGAGKTTLLVELALELERRARVDGSLPIPTLFNLAGWANDRLALDKWLIEDLILTYQVPRKQAERWVANGEVLPLLDGLDEVDKDQRAACVGAINAFHQARSKLGVVVCSRSDEYEQQGEPLALDQAVMAQPLTDAQILEYLAYGGDALAALRAQVAADEKLRDVVRTPLLLRIVALTYEGLPPDAIPPVGDHDAWVRRLFGEYVARMLKRRRERQPATRESSEETDEPVYPADVTERSLQWLAWQMHEHGMVEFYLEQLQPDWLRGTPAFRRYPVAARLVRGLIIVLVGGLASGLVHGLIGGLFPRSYVAPTDALVGVLAGVMVAQSFGKVSSKIEVKPVLRWSWDGLADALAFGSLIGLGAGLSTGLALGLTPGLIPRSYVAPADALVGGLAGRLITGLIFGLALGLIFGLASGLLDGLRSQQMDTQDYKVPNEGVHRSAKNMLAFILIFGLAFTPIIVLGGGLAVGLALGLIFGLTFGLDFVGNAAILHMVLRWQLRRTGLVPLHLVRFLDDAASHVLLQKVGGGYRFVHLTLRDYFADRYSETHSGPNATL